MDTKNRIKLTTHFYLDEFWDKLTYITYDKETLMQKLNMEFIEDLEKLRNDLDVPVTINNWWNRGIYQWRGARNENSSVFSEHSMHTCRVSHVQEVLQAVDFSCPIVSMDVRKYIIQNHLNYPSFKRMEDGVSWVHVDTKECGHEGIYLFKA